MENNLLEESSELQRDESNDNVVYKEQIYVKKNGVKSVYKYPITHKKKEKPVYPLENVKYSKQGYTKKDGTQVFYNSPYRIKFISILRDKTKNFDNEQKKQLLDYINNLGIPQN